MADPFKRGDFVWVTFHGRLTNAMIVLASPNGHSLMLMFDGALGGYVSMMPVLWDVERDSYVDLIQHEDVVVTPYPS